MFLLPSAPHALPPCSSQGAPLVGKYVVDVPSFESLALPAIAAPADAATQRLVVIDEVGE